MGEYNALNVSEHCSNSQGKEPIKRVDGLSHNEECLKFPGFKCNCRLSDVETRKNTLRKLRQELGIYTSMDLMDTKLADYHEEKRKQLCEGQPPKLWDRIKNFRIRIY